jgi:hypothetical protein
MTQHRMMAHIMTSRPPLKTIIKPTFFRGLSVELHNMGSGMERRYRSVKTLKLRLTQTT